MTSPPSRGDAVLNLWLVSEELSARIDHSLGAVHGIGWVEYMVLQQLERAPDAAMRRIDLAKAISRTASGLTRLLRPMEKIGLVEKRSNDRDARVSMVALSPLGKERLKDAKATLEELSERLTLSLGDREMDALDTSLRLLRR